jgi:hypothetical protein
MKTTLYSILSAAVRVAALLLFARSIAGLVAYFAAPERVAGMGVHWAMVIGSIVATGVALLLWLYPGLLVRPATGRAAHEIFESPLSADDIQRIGIALIGVWFAVVGISDAVYTLLRGGVLTQAENYSGGAYEFIRADLFASAFEILLGIVLALGSRGLVGLLSRIRGGR